ncbi:MAG: hypothetical protein OXG81_17120 [Acidobacteria bacterium]|nr:hypothetical protein [Acidobacteriota bacterium]
MHRRVHGLRRSRQARGSPPRRNDDRSLRDLHGVPSVAAPSIDRRWWL